MADTFYVVQTEREKKIIFGKKRKAKNQQKHVRQGAKSNVSEANDRQHQQHQQQQSMRKQIYGKQTTYESTSHCLQLELLHV